MKLEELMDEIFDCHDPQQLEHLKREVESIVQGHLKKVDDD